MILAQDSSGSALTVLLLVYLGVIVLTYAAMWRVFTKAGQPGWAAIVPLYNFFVLIKIAGRPTWWFWLLFVPVVNIVILILVAIDVADAFGKGAGFGVGLAFLWFVFYPILAWGNARYTSPTMPSGVPAGMVAPPAPPPPPPPLAPPAPPMPQAPPSPGAPAE